MTTSLRRWTLPLIAFCLLTSPAWGAERRSEALAFAAGVDPAEPDPAPVALPPTTCSAGVCQVARPRLEALLLAATVELPGCESRLRSNDGAMVALRRDLLLIRQPAPASDSPPWGWVAVGGVAGVAIGAAAAILAVMAARE